MLDTSIQLMFLYFRGLRTIYRTDGPLDFNLVGVPDLGMYILGKTRMVQMAWGCNKILVWGYSAPFR